MVPVHKTRRDTDRPHKAVGEIYEISSPASKQMMRYGKPIRRGYYLDVVSISLHQLTKETMAPAHKK